MVEQSDYPEKALAELALIEMQSKTLHEQIGYWHDLRYKAPDSFYKLQQIANQQAPEIATKLVAWYEKWNGLSHGGPREGAGRPATGAMPNRTIRMTDDEYAKVKEFLKQLRNINYIGVHDSAKITEEIYKK